MNECNSGVSGCQCLKSWKRQSRWKGKACHWLRARRLIAFRTARPFRGHLCRKRDKGGQRERRQVVCVSEHEGSSSCCFEGSPQQRDCAGGWCADGGASSSAPAESICTCIATVLCDETVLCQNMMGELSETAVLSCASSRRLVLCAASYSRRCRRRTGSSISLAFQRFDKTRRSAHFYRLIWIRHFAHLQIIAPASHVDS